MPAPAPFRASRAGLPPLTRAERRSTDGDDGAKGQHAEDSAACLFVAYRQFRVRETDSVTACSAAGRSCAWSSRRGSAAHT